MLPMKEVHVLIPHGRPQGESLSGILTTVISSPWSFPFIQQNLRVEHVCMQSERHPLLNTCMTSLYRPGIIGHVIHMYMLYKM